MHTLIVLIGVLASLSSYAQKITQVESFSPTGDVGSAEQVHVKFSDFIFPLGETNHPAPMTSACDQYGQSRWLNPQEWVFDFKKIIPPGTKCAYSLMTGLKSLKGVPVILNDAYSFEIIPAELVRTEPYAVKELSRITANENSGSGVATDQVFILFFNRKISDSEIQRRISFQIEGRKDAVGITVLPSSTLKTLKKQGQLYIDRRTDQTVVAVKPNLEFPNTQFSLVTLRDKQGDQSLYYRTRANFKVEFNCNRDNAQAPCSPIQRAALRFNAMVAAEDLQKIKAVPMHGKGNILTGELQKHTSHLEYMDFKGPFKAGETYKIEIPSGLKDIDGRKLSNQKSFPLEVKFDSLPSVAKFPGLFGVIESENPVLPLSVRNIENEIKVTESNLSDMKVGENAVEILRWMKRVRLQSERVYPTYDIRVKEAEAKAADYNSIFDSFSADLKSKVDHSTLPTAHEFNQAEVIGIPLKTKGLHVVELQSKILGQKLFERTSPLYVSTAVLLTNLGVHFKWGQRGPSLVWVTELSSGKPVSGAQITIQSCSGTTVASGKTGEDGTWVSTANLANKSSSCDGTHLVVMAKKGDDFSFTLDSFNQGLERWRFNLPYSGESNIAAHTILARDLLKPGQKVQMKHYYREFHWQGFTVPKKLPTLVTIVHNGSDEQWTLPVRFDAQGIATSEWKLADSAKLGTYSIYLGFGGKIKKTRYGRNSEQVSVGSFEVQEFRLPVMNVLFHAPDPITQDTTKPQVSVQGTYLSGGPASSLPVELRFLREKTSTHSRYIGDYLYSLDAPVKEGISERNHYEDQYGENEGDDESDSEGVPAPKKEKATLENSKYVSKTNLDSGGSAYVDIPADLLNMSEDADVKVSLTYTDPNGEIQTSVRSLSVFSRDRYLGINKKSSSYFDSDQNDLSFDFRLGEARGKAVPNAEIKVNLFESTTFTHRAKLVGGFYGYQRTTEIKKRGILCEGKTDPQGQFLCVSVQKLAPGSYFAEANAIDSKGKPVVLVQSFSVHGKEYDSDGYSESDRLTLVPSKSEYDANDEAHIEVKSSFKDATALVTLERGGVLEHFVTKISGDKPEIKLPIKMEYSPNLVLSVFEVRGRLNAPSATGLLDLAKPAFKLGMTELKIGIKSHELPIAIQTDQKVYQVRSNVKVTIETKPGAELALAVIDQALLKIKPNETLNLLNDMMITQGHSVETSTMQMNLIGKRHFGKKATPFGGGGGKMMTRELLDSLVAWKPRLIADANGKIATDFKLNDAISGFTIVAVGSQGLDFYGTKKTDIAATQDLQIISSVPLGLRENDELPLQFLLRNTTLSPLHVKAALKIGDAEQSPIEVEVPAQGTKEVKWETKVPYGAKTLPLLITAKSKEGAQDQLKISSSIAEVAPTSVREGFLTQITKTPTVLPVSFPADALKDKGGYRVQLQARLSEIPTTILNYLVNYPFSCMEQQTSKAIGTNDLKAWLTVQDKFKSYLDSNTILKFFPGMQYGSVDLSAYVFGIASQASLLDKRFAIAKETALSKRMLDALQAGMEGRILISQFWWPDYVDNNDRIAAAEALSAYRAISQADYEALKSVHSQNELSQSLSLLKVLDQSAKSLEKSLLDREQFMKEILNHYEYENTHLNLKDAQFRFFGGLAASPDALNARALIAFLDHDKKDEATKLLRTLVDKAKTGSFDSTPADAWATIALRMFKQKYEKDAVSGQLTVAVSAVSKTLKISEKVPKAETFVPVKEALAKNQSTSLSLSYAGTGNPWSFTLVEAAVPLKSNLDHGYSIIKTVKPIQTTTSGVNTHGDIYEVTLQIEAMAQQTWIALTDPIPSGASILSTESNEVATAFEERRMDRMQAFFEYVPKGKFSFKYRVRLNQQGKFEFPSTRVEAMYDPTQYGEVPNASMLVKP